MDNRAFGSLTDDDLARLAEIARIDREGLFSRCQHLERYRDRILAVALCQGGALHYVDGLSGIKDLDVWTLYAADDGGAYPCRRRGEAKFGPSGLTSWSERVDLLGRSLPFAVGDDPMVVWHEYLGHPRTQTAWFLAQRPVVMIEPSQYRGKVVWPTN